LEELRQRNPEEFQRRRQRLAEEVRHLLDLRERDSELFRVHLEEMGLRDELNRLAREARREKAGSKERQEAERKLKEAVQRSFDLRHRIKEAELKELRGRLAELEGSLERRASRRSEMIDERLRELLGSGEEDW
jgi:tyrosyl-tRNA synthetase